MSSDNSDDMADPTHSSWKLWVAIALPIVTFFGAASVALRFDLAGAWVLATTAFVFTMAAIFVGLLGWKVGGSTLTLERKIDEVRRENHELRGVVNALLKSVTVLAYGASKGELPPELWRLLGTYMGRIKHLGSPNLVAEATQEIKGAIERAKAKSEPKAGSVATTVEPGETNPNDNGTSLADLFK
jgi:hypothetical protein